MPWFNTDDKLHSHPKSRAAGLEALGLWLLAGCHSVAVRNPGFASSEYVYSFPRGRTLAKRLVRAGFWEPVPGGWDFLYGGELWSVRYDRFPIPAELRAAVYERDRWRCLHCGTTENLSLDHIWPYSKGGPDTYENLQTLCRPCNSKKGAKTDGPGRTPVDQALLGLLR